MVVGVMLFFGYVFDVVKLWGLEVRFDVVFLFLFKNLFM